jgi:hypothetical protein
MRRVDGSERGEVGFLWPAAGDFLSAKQIELQAAIPIQDAAHCISLTQMLHACLQCMQFHAYQDWLKARAAR